MILDIIWTTKQEKVLCVANEEKKEGKLRAIHRAFVGCTLYIHEYDLLIGSVN